MYRDLSTTSSTGTPLFDKWEDAYLTIIPFVDKYILTFVSYYNYQGRPTGENRITNLLIHHFNTCHQGYLPFYFDKNPTQSTGYRETDIGVYAKDGKMTPLLPIFEFEAKKLSTTSANKEYVCGERGGMERFKRQIHSPHLPYCGMLGYVLCKDLNHWTAQINTWITNLANQSPIDGLDWQGNGELLHPIGTNGTIAKLVSKNKRVSLPDIIMLHYLIDLQ